MIASEDVELGIFLLRSAAGANKTRVKQWLQSGSVSLNGRTVTSYHQPLQQGDQVELLSRRARTSRVVPLWDLRIVHEDDALVVIEKPPRLLTVATEKIHKKTAMYAVQDYLRRRGKVRGKQAFIVHRLDRDASGLLVFARTQEVKLALQGAWQDVSKEYYAVVEGRPPKPKGTVESYLRQNRILRVSSTKDQRGAYRSVTHYEVLETSARYALLRVRLGTGRKHQIRVHLADLGTPIAGDQDYGARTDPAGRLALHAFRLAFRHPVDGRELACETPLPEAFRRILIGDAEA